MTDTFFLVFRVAAALVFAVTAYAGVYLFRNYEKLFGIDPDMPSETGSSRAYSQIQVFAIWVHVLIASAAFALLLH